MPINHDLVYADKLGANKQKQLELNRNTADERRINEIAQWLIDENAIVSLQSIVGSVKRVIYNEDDLVDKKGLTVNHIGCIKVEASIKDFPILPAAGAWIKPLDAQVRSYPIVGETVVIINYGAQTYYFQPLNLRNSATHNIVLGIDKDASNKGSLSAPVKPLVPDNIDAYLQGFVYNKNPRPVKQYPGDWALNGRNDQSIRIGTDYTTNGDSELNSANAVIKMRISDESEASEAAAGTPRTEDIDTDKASLYLTRSEDIKYTVSPKVEGVTDVKTAGAPAIILDSDRLVFNTKENTNTGQINMFSGNTTNIVSKLNTNIVGEKVLLGDVDEGNLQSAVLGENLVNFLGELVATLDSFAAKIAGIKGLGNIGTLVPIPEGMAAGAQLQGWTASTAKPQIANRILSKNVKVSKKSRSGL